MVNSSLWMILLSVCCGVIGQLSLKTGMTQVGRLGSEAMAQPIATALHVATNPFVVLGLGLYGLGAVSWLAVLSRVPLSYAYPIGALSYAITPMMAWLLLSENMPSIRWVGIVAICVGVVLVSKS